MPLPKSIIVMPGAVDGYSSSIVYKLASLRYIFCIRCDYLRDQTSAGSLFKELMFWTHYAFLPAFLRFVQNVWKAFSGIFFLVYSACMNFFHLIFPCMNFFGTSSPPITFLMVRPLARLITSSESQGAVSWVRKNGGESFH